jgi:hypothetical protein
MNNTKLVGLVAVLALLAGVVGGYVVNKLSPLVGGDFAGGIVPSQLFSASTATNSVSPILSNLLVPGAVSVGGVAANDQITTLYTATTSYPAGTSTVSLGPVTSASSAATTTVGGLSGPFAVGDACEVTYTGAPTNTAFGADAFISAVNGNAASATVTLWNGGAATTTFTGSSTLPLVLKATCFHTGV